MAIFGWIRDKVETAPWWVEKGNRAATPEEQCRCYDRALEIDPNNAAAWNNKGNALHLLNRYEEAIQCYEKVIEIDSNNAGAWNNKGYALHSLNRYDEAIRCYDRALELNPKIVDSWNNKGNALTRLKQYDEAVQCYDRALELDPTDAVAWSNKGSVILGLRRFDEAIQCCDRALEIYPTDAVAWSNKGRALLILSRYEDAIRCYDRALEIDPYDDDAWYYKGCALHNLDQYEEAIRCYDKPLEIYPKFALAWINKGDALHHLGRYDEAIRCCDRALELDPADATAQNMRDRILVESAKNARKIRSMPPRSGEAGQSLQPSAHPGEPAGTRQSITIERTVYDPLTQDFIVSSPRPLPNIKDWIDHHDPNSYWLVICVRNNGDHAIDEWGIELESSSALQVLDAAIEGIEGQVHLMASNPKPWRVRSILGVSHHQGIVIPRDSSRRVYFRLGSESCGTAHIIQGMFITGSVKVPIHEKAFTHSCDVATLHVALSKNPTTAEKYAGNIIRREYDRDTALKLLRSFKLVQEIDQCCTLQNYDEILNQMQLLADTLENIQAGDKLTRLVKQNYDALTILGDSEASAVRAQQLCSNVIDVWINEFICMEDPKKHSIKSKPRERGEDAGKCPVCGSRLVWRRAQKNNELYRGCTNFDGGCRWNDRSY